MFFLFESQINFYMFRYNICYSFIKYTEIVYPSFLLQPPHLLHPLCSISRMFDCLTSPVESIELLTFTNVETGSLFTLMLILN